MLILAHYSKPKDNRSAKESVLHHRGEEGASSSVVCT